MITILAITLEAKTLSKLKENKTKLLQEVRSMHIIKPPLAKYCAK